MKTTKGKYPAKAIADGILQLMNGENHFDKFAFENLKSNYTVSDDKTTHTIENVIYTEKLTNFSFSIKIKEDNNEESDCDVIITKIDPNNEKIAKEIEEELIEKLESFFYYINKYKE